jgi:hypothetical protein
MTTTAKTWTYEQYLAAVLPQGVAATVAEHDLADGHQIGRNDGLDDWLDQSEATTWDEDLAMKGERPEEWCAHHHRALAELVDAIEAKAQADADADDAADDAAAAAEAVENAIGKSQDEIRVIKIGDSKAVRSVLSQKCDDNCDGDGGCYWGENKHGSWCVCVRIGVES